MRPLPEQEPVPSSSPPHGFSPVIAIWEDRLAGEWPPVRHTRSARCRCYPLHPSIPFFAVLGGPAYDDMVMRPSSE